MRDLVNSAGDTEGDCGAPYATNFALYRAAVAADDAYQRELVRVYGRGAGDMRYKPRLHTDAALIAARDAKMRADQAWQTEMRRASLEG